MEAVTAGLRSKMELDALASEMRAEMDCTSTERGNNLTENSFA